MNALGMSVADWIGQVHRPLAVGAASRHRERVPGELVGLAGPLGIDAPHDVEIRLDHLGQALAAGRPELFEQHVEWLKVTFHGQGADPAYVRIGLECLRDELAATLPEDARSLATTYVEHGIAAFDRAASETPSFLPDDAPLVDCARRYLLAALEGRRQDAIRTVLDAADQGTPIDDLLQHVIEASQRELGRMWQIGDVHTAEEHFASRIAERLTDELHARLPAGARNGRSILVASVGGNDHDLGARFVADRFELAGWNPVLLGANAPGSDIARAVVDFAVDLVALSASTTLQVRSTATAIGLIRRLDTARRIPVLVGGGPFRTVANLWRDVDADGTAPDTLSAIAIAQRLVDSARAGRGT